MDSHVLQYKTISHPDKAALAQGLMTGQVSSLPTSWDSSLNNIVNPDVITNLLPNWRLASAPYPSSLTQMPLFS